MKKKGFTLIELLATIIILAVIALIAVPQILNVIDNSKKESFRNSVSGIIRAVQQHYSDELDYELNNNGLYYNIEGGVLYLYSNDGSRINIPYSGSLKTATGQIIVQSDESLYATVDYSKWCAIKKYNSSEVEVYSIDDKEKCHDELLRPTVTLVATNMTTNEAYISGDWTDSSVQLYVMTDSIDNSNYEYVWYRNDQIIKGASSSFYVVDSETEAAEYSVSIINSKGKVFDSENVVDVNIDKLMPTCKFILNSVHEENGWYTGIVVATLDTSSIFSSLANYGVSIGVDASYNSLKEVTIVENGEYEVYGKVENALGKVGTCYKKIKKDDITNFAVTVNAVLEGTSKVYTSGTVSTSNVVLTGAVNPGANLSGYTYQWYKNNKKISGATKNIYTASSSGNYYLEVTAGNGTVNKSNEIVLKIDAVRPTCDFSITSGTLGSNGWYTSNVVVSLTKKDAARYDITTSSSTSYNNNSSVTLSSSSNVYCYVASETGVSTNSNSKTINIDKTAPTISSLSGTSTTVSGYNTTSLKLTAVASDSESGILRYEFYKISQEYSDEVLLGSNTTGIYTVSNPANGYNYKVKVYNKAGLSSENVLTESCSISTTGTCYYGTKTDIYTCTTGRQYGVTTSSGCVTTTQSSSSSCSGISCGSGFYVCGCSCCSYSGSSSGSGGFKDNSELIIETDENGNTHACVSTSGTCIGDTAGNHPAHVSCPPTSSACSDWVNRYCGENPGTTGC